MEFENNVIYTQADTGLNRFFARIYGFVGLGIGLSAFVSWMMLYVFPQNLVNIAVNAMWVYYVAIFGELGLVMVASSAARRNTPAALPLFLAYSALNGFTLSFVLLFYTQADVFMAFLSAAVVFIAMAIVGVTVKKDLSGIAKAGMAALIGIIVASLINLFFQSSLVTYGISILSVLIFSGLIAYDNQMIKRVYQETNGNVGLGWAISMALSLYLDFINLFLNLLRIFGRND